ncbi:MAG: hypothetical protein WBX03_13945 [Terriglobales bacterium]|jgi:hypothetical protein
MSDLGARWGYSNQGGGSRGCDSREDGSDVDHIRLTVCRERNGGSLIDSSQLIPGVSALTPAWTAEVER